MLDALIGIVVAVTLFLLWPLIEAATLFLNAPPIGRIAFLGAVAVIATGAYLQRD